MGGTNPVGDGPDGRSKTKKSYERPKITRKIAELRSTRYIFAANGRLLMDALMFIRKPAAILVLSDARQMETYHLEIVRLLHNYLASATTLVDHTRILVDEFYLETDFGREYEARKKSTFVDSSLVQFVQRLRNYMLHQALPFTSVTQRLQSGELSELDCFVNLDLATLRLWSGWSQKAREYLNRVENRVRLDELVTGYSRVVTEFYEWFDSRERELYFGWINGPLALATVTSVSPLMVTADGAKTPCPAAKEPNARYALGDRVWVHIRTPRQPLIKGLQSDD